MDGEEKQPEPGMGVKRRDTLRPLPKATEDIEKRIHVETDEKRTRFFGSNLMQRQS
jgi:hypothetical protein